MITPQIMRRKYSYAPRWMVTFADLMALLLALFVMLLSFAEIDSDSFRRNAGPISEAFNTKFRIEAIPKPSKSIRLKLDSEGAEPTYIKRTRFLNHLKDEMAEEIEKSMVEVLEKDRDIVIRFPDKAAFASGSMILSKSILPALDKIANFLEASEGQVTVAGHTDDTPISTGKIRSNWDLSTARAVSVVHHLLATTKVTADRITAQGFADSRPLAPNATPEGRAKNRRVEITFEMFAPEDEEGQ